MRNEVTIMRMKSLPFVLGLLITLPGAVLSEETSVIVTFKRQPGYTEQSLIKGAKGKIHRSHQIIPAVTASLPREEIEKLKKNSQVARVELNAVYRLVAPTSAEMATVTSPTGSTLTTAASTAVPKTELDRSLGLKRIRADVAHAAGNMGTGIKIAILDTGIDYNHKDLKANYIGGHNFVFGDNDPFDDNSISHGTHVAGIIAARENGIGMIGVAPKAKILAVKVLDGAGFGTADWIIAGIDWAVANGAQIINMSLEGADTQALKDACDKARAAGVLLVAAGGNSAAGGQPVSYPAGYDSVIAVTAINFANKPAYFSPIDAKLELAAPGASIFSTVRGGYARLSGTSQAAPFVTGAAALYLRCNTQDINRDGRIDAEDVRLLLQSASTDLGTAGRDPVFGFGMVNAARALPPNTTTTISKSTSSAR